MSDGSEMQDTPLANISEALRGFFILSLLICLEDKKQLYTHLYGNSQGNATVLLSFFCFKELFPLINFKYLIKRRVGLGWGNAADAAVVPCISSY